MNENSNKSYLIFVLPEEFDENKMEYSDAITWAHTNSSNKNVLKLTLDDIYLLDERVLDIINKENNSMIGPYEDNWVFSQEVKQSIIEKLKIYYVSANIKREINLICEIIRLLEFGLKIDHNIYFLF